MPLTHEGWKTGEEKAKTAKIVRSLAQDDGRTFKRETLGMLYPEKKSIDSDGKEIDIGQICSDWAYTILTAFAYDERLLTRYMTMIHIAYQRGENLNTKRSWVLVMRTKGIIGFSSKIDPMPVIAKLSFMGNLEKPKKKSSGYGNVRW